MDDPARSKGGMKQEEEDGVYGGENSLGVHQGSHDDDGKANHDNKPNQYRKIHAWAFERRRRPAEVANKRVTAQRARVADYTGWRARRANFRPSRMHNTMGFVCRLDKILTEYNSLPRAGEYEESGSESQTLVSDLGI
jgi:hypothetical protein